MGRRRPHKRIPQPVYIEGNENAITKYRGDDNTVRQLSRNQRDVDIARIAVKHEKARRPSKLIEGIVYLLSRGGKRDARRIEVEQELKKLDLQCRAFTQAVRAMLNGEREKTRRFEASMPRYSIHGPWQPRYGHGSAESVGCDKCLVI